MHTLDSKIKFLLIFLLLISISLLLISILNIFPLYEREIKIIIFVNSLLFTVYFLAKSRLDQTLTFAIICVLFNPYFSIRLDDPIWRILEFPILCLFIHRLYFLIFENQFKQVEQDATKIDHYFRELEYTLSPLSYHQISIYIKRKFSENAQLSDTSISWINTEIPFVRFEVLKEYYSFGKQSKGGVSGKILDKYNNIEIHLNFNLTHEVKFTIKQGTGENKPKRLAKHLKNILVNQYHYLDL